MTGRTQAPDGWLLARLGDVAKLGSGKAPSYNDYKGRVPVLGANGRIGLAAEHNFSRGIAVGRVGASGSVHYVLDPVWLSDNVLSVEPHLDVCDQLFLYSSCQRQTSPL